MGDRGRDARLDADRLPRFHPALRRPVRRGETDMRGDTVGWFSDRTACYLAAGVRARAGQGWTTHLPSEQGLLAFSGIDEAVAGIDRINADTARHTACAVEIAQEHFDARSVLPRLRDGVRENQARRSGRDNRSAAAVGSLRRCLVADPGPCRRGHDVTLFATADSTTAAKLHAITRTATTDRLCGRGSYARC